MGNVGETELLVAVDAVSALYHFDTFVPNSALNSILLYLYMANRPHPISIFKRLTLL